MLLADFLKRGVKELERVYPLAEARSIITILCEALLGTKNYTHIIEPSYEIPSLKEEGLNDALRRLLEGEPIQYIIGFTEFCGFKFKVGKEVLIPRPETELLCREAVRVGSMLQRIRMAYGKTAKPVRVLDLCTGSGCIAWTMALSIPSSSVVGVDLSEKALALARSQDFSKQLKEAGGIPPSFMHTDILDENIPLEGVFDLVLCNPPYIKEEEKALMRKNVLDYEPALALFVPDEEPLLFYKALIAWSDKLLSKEGTGIAEINENLGEETRTLFKNAGYSYVELIKDLYDKNRFIIYKK